MGSTAGRRTASIFYGIDWYLFLAALIISILGLLTMRPAASEPLAFFDRQMFWIAISCAVFFLVSLPEYNFLRRSRVVVALYCVALALLAAVFVFGTVVKGAQNRFDLGFFAVQPSDPAKLILAIVLAKYFARRHVAIGHIRHILVSGIYAFLLCVLVFLQPDFGGAIIIASIWLGMVLVAGISWRHLATLIITGLLCVGALWQYGLADYQKERVLSFIHPLADIQGAGYNAYQATVAVGSGEWIGKGIGYGSQSKLRFLPEYQTDFIFAAYAEEWGFVGVILLFGLYAVVIVRVLANAARAPDNFATLFGVGVAVMFTSNFLVHVGMNIGLLPVTGTTIPFMSYGGSHLVTEFAALGMVMGLGKWMKPTSAVVDKTELVARL
ncbi:rod shape-determining protein RodA [Candidatus Kaiserbacteria bacterium]|nr:rod shape-determining protein RodA [Candidatus Kaiserbacteria bacterium]